MLIKISDDFYIGENAIVSVEKTERGYTAETVTGTRIILDEDALNKLTKKPAGRPKKEGNNGSDK